MTKYSLEVIPEPEEGSETVFQTNQGEDFIFIEGGDDSYLCGACNKILCENVNRGQMMNIVFKCPKCGNYNKIKGI